MNHAEGEGLMTTAVVKKIYADCQSGIAGDMFLGAMLDLACGECELREGLATLGLHGWELRVTRGKRGGISGIEIKVENDEHHPHRHLEDIEELINESGIPVRAKEMSMKAFRLLAQAEAKVHGTTADHIHFHEVGAVDSIVDIVGAMILMDRLGWPEIEFSPLNVGSGTVRCAHGLLPVPAPAVAELLKGLETYSEGEPMERVTPTGALLVRLLAGKTTSEFRGAIVENGIGLGGRESDIPNILRLRAVLPNQSSDTAEPVYEIAANIDDMPAEDLGAAMERLLEAGALDVWFEPIQMKKNRPAVKLCVLARPEERSALAVLILRSTTTFGVRMTKAERMTLRREFVERDTPIGRCRFKRGFLDGELLREMPEYEELKRLAAEKGISVSEARSKAGER